MKGQIVIRKTFIIFATVIVLISAGSNGQTRSDIDPTFKDVKYGPHERNNLNFWQAESDKPLGIHVHIHGGGWFGGEKQKQVSDVYLKRSYHYASINYPLARYGDHLPSMVYSAARAIQFLRYKAKDWNIDPDRILVSGGSAGGASSLWIAYHDDMADPNSDDPIAQQSSRVAGAVANGAQSTLDPFIIEKRIGPETLKHNMLFLPVGAKDIDDLKKNWQSKYKKLSEECTALLHVTKDDPPVFLHYGDDNTIPAKNQGHGIHHGMFGVILKEKADEIGVKVYLDFGDIKPEIDKNKFVNMILANDDK